MATIRPAIVPAKALKDGKHKIRIAIAHNGQTRYIPTDIILDEERQLRKGSIVKHPNAAYLNTKLRSIVQRFQDAYDEIIYPDGMSCSEIVSLIKTGGQHKRMTFTDLYDEYMSVAEVGEGTKASYLTAYKALAKAIKPNTVIDNISPATIMSVEKSLRKYAAATFNLYMTLLRTLLNHAIRNGYVEYRINPFVNASRRRETPRDSWLSKEDIIKIRDCEIKSKYTACVRDIFMLSYYLGGINLIDLLGMTFDAKADKLRYVRSKVKKLGMGQVEFDMPDEARPVIERITGKSGRIEYKERGDSNRPQSLSYHMKRIAKAAGITSTLVFYSARKSFAQHALELGVKESTIDYILGHSLSGSRKMLYHYVYVTPQMATEAIRKVLDNLK